jgi:iron complex transport system substrate-binding protein
MKLDRQKEVKNIINIARNLLNQNTQLKNLNMAKVFWEVGARPLYTAGKLSFFNDYNRYTNTINIYENIEKRYFAADVGDVVFRNPDIILIVNMKGTSTEEIKIWNAYKMMNAVKDNKVFLLKTDDVFTLTPIKFAKSVKMLRGLLSNAK